MAGSQGKAQVEISSTQLGTATITGKYKGTASAKLTVKFVLSPGGNDGSTIVFCDISIAPKVGASPEIEADGEASLDIVATVFGADGAPAPEGTSVTFETNDVVLRRFTR